MIKYITIGLTALMMACSSSQETETVQDKEVVPVMDTTISNRSMKSEHVALFTDSIVLDGLADDPVWDKSEWYEMNYIWLGDTTLSSDDFSGRFKIAWNNESLFLLAEIVDDTLIDIHEDKFTQWWDDDCLEIFIDENNGEDLHQFNHKAFAYHVGLNGDIVDLGPDSLPHLYNDHVTCERTNNGDTYIWECKIAIYDDTFVDGEEENTLVRLEEGKRMGFSLAYCDNDHSETRENFIGSSFIGGLDKDQGWKDAGVFGKVTLVKE